MKWMPEPHGWACKPEFARPALSCARKKKPSNGGDREGDKQGSYMMSLSPQTPDEKPFYFPTPCPRCNFARIGSWFSQWCPRCDFDSLTRHLDRRAALKGGGENE
jgi:hypothetical protein